MPSLFGNIQKRRRWCRDCDRYVLAEETPFNNVLHATLLVLTCFLWLPVMLLAMVWHQMTAGGYRCPRCGGRC